VTVQVFWQVLQTYLSVRSAALHRHFDRDGAFATVGTWQSEFTFGFRMDGSLPVAMATGNG